MSETPPPAPPPPPPQRPGGSPRAPLPASRSGCLSAILLVVGIIMLLPGLCALIFGGLALTEPHGDAGIVPFVVVGLAIGFAGVMLIWNVIRSLRS